MMFLSVAVVTLTFACADAGSTEKDFPVDISDSRNLEIYFFDPETALKMLLQGSTDIFTPLITTTSDEYMDAGLPPVKSEAYLWNYSEYLRAADIIQKQTWGDDAMFDWDLLRMSFNADCQDPLTGFSTADLYYFRPITVDGKSKYAGRQIVIRPLYGDVVSGFGANYPHQFLDDWKNIDLNKLKITPDNVLQLAEKNGGKDFRIAIKNNCWVFLSYYAGDEGWFISYHSRKSSSEEFRMNINPYTGKFEILSH